MSSAGLGWDPARRTIVMPDMIGSQVAIIKLP
jgi:hypothetical protein